MVTQMSSKQGRRGRRPPGPPDERSGDYQFGRAMMALGSVGEDDEQYAGVNLAEANVHAVLALGAYTRDLAASLRELAARPAGYPADQLAELIGEMFAAARTATDELIRGPQMDADRPGSGDTDRPAVAVSGANQICPPSAQPVREGKSDLPLESTGDDRL